MVTTKDEVERKYDGPRVSPDLLADVPHVRKVTGPEHMSLDATYYDTPDLRLARVGITLRRRSGGDDAGWHAKLPQGIGDRTEIQAPPGPVEDRVPDELADLLRTYTTTQPLVPCAHITTERDRWQLVGKGGVVLAEIADDSVRARTLGAGEQQATIWHEVEVELGTAGPDLLDDVAARLTGSGVRPSEESSKLARTLGDRFPRRARRRLTHKSSAGEVVAAYLREQLDRLRAADIAVRLGEPDGVHDMRVAVRRLRSTLRTFGAIMGRDRTRSVAVELTWLSDVLGAARDSEVLQRQLSDELDATPPELVLGPVRAELDRQLSRRAADADAAMRSALNDGRYLALLDALDELLVLRPTDGIARKRAGNVLPKLVRKSFRKARRRAVGAQNAPEGPERDIALHQVRKAVKRVRYASETAAPVIGKPADKIRRRTKRVQEILGEHHDLVELRTRLREAGIQAYLDGANAFTFGLLHGRSGERARRREREFPTAWHRLTRGGATRWMRG